MIKLVIFDMDGVLVDSEPAITKASMDALAEWGVDAKYSDFKQYTGMGDDKFIGGVAEKYGVKYDIRMKERAYGIYLATASERVTVYPWSKKLISALAPLHTLAIASASDYTKVKCNVECIGVDTSLFGAIVTGSDVQNKKPAPDIFLKAAEKAGLIDAGAKSVGGAAVVIEDALSGVRAAKAAGAYCIAVTTSFDDVRLREAGADFVVDDLCDAAGIIAGL